MKIRMMLMTFISASCLSAMSTKDAPPSDYGVPTNSVVATPVGYEKRITLDTGETVRMYPDKLSPEEYAKCRAALFCILSPDTLRGKYFVCCNWFLQNDDPIKYGRRRNTYGILTDDAKKEAVGFDLGSSYGDSRDSDSRQQHYVRVLRSEKDRRELYSFLLKAKDNSLRREPQAGHGGLTLMMPPYLRTAHEGL